MPSKKRVKREGKRIAKKHRMGKPGERSNYAKKQSYLIANGGRGTDWEDKPWK